MQRKSISTKFSEEDVAQVFSGDIANEWDKKSAFIESVDGDDNLLPHIIQRLVVGKEPQILDIGCGTGKFIEKVDVILPNAVATGIDISGDMINIASAKQYANRHRFWHSSIQDFTSEKLFDIALFRQVLHHIPVPEGALAAAASLLAPGGYIIVMTPSEDHARSLVPFVSNDDPLGRMSQSRIAEIAKSAGMKIVEAHQNVAIAKFSSAFRFFQYLRSVGSLQKLFKYGGEVNAVDRFVAMFETVLATDVPVSVEFGYAYYTLVMEGAYYEPARHAAQ